VPYWLLARFSPFINLDDLQRQFVARGHTIRKKPAGVTLIELGSKEDITLYLIDGTLELEAFDGRTFKIVGGTYRAYLPVSQLRPHAYTVRAVTDVSVILVSQDMVREINRIATTYKSRPVSP
jgi:CRP-like cAMP-binding protein